MDKRKTERGQGLVEMVVVLPVLLILLLGIVEVGYALRDYIIVTNADREGCRLAARGRFTDANVAERVVSAGGSAPSGGMPFLRTHGPDPNTGIIITHIPMDKDGAVAEYTIWISGVTSSEAGEVQPIGAGHSVISATMPQIVQRHRESTQNINATRAAAGYEEMGNHIVVVEVFFMHHPLWDNPLLPLPDPWMMHARTEMRVVSDRGGGRPRFFDAW